MTDGSSSSSTGLRVVVSGATGNVGTSVVEALGRDPAIGSVLGLARRVPEWSAPKTTWAAADICEADLTAHFDGADAVVHLAWRFGPTHDPVVTWRTNVLGSIRVFRAAAAAGVPALVHASSVGAYSPGPEGHPKDQAVNESWPTHGWPDAAYCREKAYLERVLDGFEHEHPGLRVVRMRPAFIFKREAAAEQSRIFAGFVPPRTAVSPKLLPRVPDLPGLRVQVLHASDAADAYRRAVLRPVRGAFNLAAEPPVDAHLLAELLGVRSVHLPVGPPRALLAAAWHLRAVPASPHLFDAVLRLPLLDTTRAREELGWSPARTAEETVRELLAGLRTQEGLPTPPLHPPRRRWRAGSAAA
ncbi:SDR family oxidoreductase [Kitasatospora sp. CMC57]|uniref:SDR family oxidoreductase n=1 Tax=Kitasatospora sp. CMC57 TaxID=3231513 RepID=A0AB33JT49_9ACTN